MKSCYEPKLSPHLDELNQMKQVPDKSHNSHYWTLTQEAARVDENKSYNKAKDHHMT